MITPYYTNQYVLTPNGSQVSTYYNMVANEHYYTDGPEIIHYTDYSMSLVAADMIRTYPNATQLSVYNPAYNCHSYAWHSQSTGNKHWIDNPSAYMNDGSYSSVSGIYVRTNDKLYYPSGQHSAIVQNNGDFQQGTITVKSKWSFCGLFEHTYDDCPYEISNAVAYRR